MILSTCKQAPAIKYRTVATHTTIKEPETCYKHANSPINYFLTTVFSSHHNCNGKTYIHNCYPGGYHPSPRSHQPTLSGPPSPPLRLTRPQTKIPSRSSCREEIQSKHAWSCGLYITRSPFRIAYHTMCCVEMKRLDVECQCEALGELIRQVKVQAEGGVDMQDVCIATYDSAANFNLPRSRIYVSYDVRRVVNISLKPFDMASDYHPPSCTSLELDYEGFDNAAVLQQLHKDVVDFEGQTLVMSGDSVCQNTKTPSVPSSIGNRFDMVASELEEAMVVIST
ncbi:hypothetical protein LWI28_001275 [Acer negundo]|uniref:Uncharacterized protein n=1 Tax=Acer negundo TaxID=4023 RepID=A0AAD5J2Q9_ACENE|nr:hypothetical protein LWI28_001275 [Acer negundo]